MTRKNLGQEGASRLPGEGAEVDKDKLVSRVENLLEPGILTIAVASAPSKYRKRLLTIDVVMLAVVHFVLSRLNSFLAVVDHLRNEKVPGVAAIEVTPTAFYKRLRVLSHKLFLQLLRETTAALAKDQKYHRSGIRELAPFATGVKALDDTTLDALMRKTKWLQEYKKGAYETLGGRLGCALDLTTGKLAELMYDEDAKASEKNHARPLIERLPAGTLYVFDLGYFSFPFFDYLSERFCYFVTRMRNKTTYKVVHVLADGPNYRDRVIYLGKYRADQAAHPVRLVELKLAGTWLPYLTNVLDPKVLPAAKVWALYSQRWTIEMAFAAIKRSLEMAFLRASNLNGVLIQIWSTLTVYQVLQDLRLEIAHQSGWADDDVSWLNLMRWIGWYSERPEKLPLREWLIENAEKAGLKKRGVRKRREDSLPSEVLAACEPPPAGPDVAALSSRASRQGKPEPRTNESVTIVARLSSQR